YEPPPPPPPAPPPAPPKLVNREEIQTLLDEHGYESFRSATLTLEKAGTALPVNALAIAKTRVLATLAYGPEAFPLGPAQTAVAQLGSLDPESVEGVTPERIRQERLKAQAGLAILEAETEGVIDPLTKASEARPDDPELAYLLGKAHEVAGRPSEALVYFDRALVARPDYSQASRNIGRLLEAEGAENEAAIWFEKAWSANPSDARSALDAARLHKKSGRPGLEREAIVAAARGAPRGLPPDERAAALLSAVRSLDDSGQLSKAADLASEAARLAPADARAVGFLAVAKSLEGDHTGALALLEPVLQRNPEELAALVARARVHMKAGDVAKALLDLESARPLDEGPEVLMWLARCNRQIGKISDAEAALKLASERPGSTAAKVELSRLALAVGNVEEAFSEAEAAVKADPKSLPARVQLGRALAGRGELEQAEQVFEKALGLDEDSNEARLGLGNALREQAERSERPRRSKALGRATALYLQVLNDNPDDAAVLYEYGRVLELQSNLRGAIRLYERAASLDERDVRPHLMMVSAHLRTQNPKAARASLEKAEEIDLASGNQSGEVRFWAARLALVDGDAAKAVAAMKQAVELAPENAEYWLWLGRGLERNNSLFEAIAAYEKAVRLNSRLAPAHRALGRAAIERHRYPEAREHLERFRRFAPDDASVWSDIGETFSGENRDREALDAFEKALNADPEALRALIEAGKIHSRQGKDKVAQASFRKATRSHPRSGEAWCLLGLSLAQRKVSREARQALQKCRDGDGPGDLVDSANELLDAR
ncbi:MAG: tetratricopeptide repeat protein, partial [Myxococcota bacterium]